MIQIRENEKRKLPVRNVLETKCCVRPGLSVDLQRTASRRCMQRAHRERKRADICSSVSPPPPPQKQAPAPAQVQPPAETDRPTLFECRCSDGGRCICQDRLGTKTPENSKTRDRLPAPSPLRLPDPSARPLRPTQRTSYSSAAPAALAPAAVAAGRQRRLCSSRVLSSTRPSPA
jgi:hypothetical protein